MINSPVRRSGNWRLSGEGGTRPRRGVFPPSRHKIVVPTGARDALQGQESRSDGQRVHGISDVE